MNAVLGFYAARHEFDGLYVDSSGFQGKKKLQPPLVRSKMRALKRTNHDQSIWFGLAPRIMPLSSKHIIACT